LDSPDSDLIAAKSMGQKDEARRSLHSTAPDDLLVLVALPNFLRLSLLKAAHAFVFSAARQEIRVRPG
jgi:hypothetical protein